MYKAKAIAATLVAAALSVIASVPAQATSSWMVGGTELSGSAALATTARKIENIKLKFSAITVECSGENTELVSPQIEGTNKGSATSIQFTECKATGKNCALAAGMREKIATGPVSEEATLEGLDTEKVEIKVRPKTGTLFATLTFEGSACVLAEEIQPISGQAKLEGPTGHTEHTYQEVVSKTTEASKELRVGSASAYIEGTGKLELSSGKTWSLL